MKKELDAVLEQLERNQELAKVHLDRQAFVVRAIDKKIEKLEQVKKKLEEEKQKELVKMEDYLELAMKMTHSLSDGYTITYDNKRKIEINSVSEFLRWLKANCETSEVLSFFEDAIKLANLKKFVEKKCDQQRLSGIMNPKVDGVTVGDITFRRLTTFTKEKKNV